MNYVSHCQQLGVTYFLMDSIDTLRLVRQKMIDVMFFWEIEGLGVESVLCYEPAFILSRYYVIIWNYASYLGIFNMKWFDICFIVKY